MRKFEKEKRFPNYVIAGFYILVGIFICYVLFLFGSSLAKNPLTASGSVLPVSASASPKEDDTSDSETIDESGLETDDTESVYYSFVTTNTKTALNVRKQPGMDSEIIYRLSPGTTGYVLEQGESWSLIQTTEITGYVSNKYLKFEEIPEEEYLSEAEGASQ